MKNINILSLVQAYRTLKRESFESFLEHYGIQIKSTELDDLQSLVELLHPLADNISIFSNFYVTYKIPQIGKEFDLLWFGNECIINIELKSDSKEDKIKKQLIRNEYYLSYIGKTVYNISYESKTKKLYFLDSNKNLKIVNTEFIINLLSNNNCSENKENIDTLFDPSYYLVSPFNSTSKFLDNLYFLTHQQEEIKTNIINSFSSTKSTNFISIIGGAGTGKTLLVYDIAKELIKIDKKILIIHCGYLNKGQIILNRQRWNIIPIKEYSSYKLSNYDLIIIDEAQRIQPPQLKEIVKTITANNGNCIFSYDKLQTLSTWEENRNIDSLINNINQLTTYKLSEKIRTNKEIATFTKMLFNNTRNLKLSNSENIEINYFQNHEDAKNYLSSLDNIRWEVIRFTPSQYHNEYHDKYSDLSKKTSHKVIGQEFDGVAVTIDKYFTYDERGELIYAHNSYYYPVKMLFQNITRARKRVNLVIIDNEELLNRCLRLLE